MKFGEYIKDYRAKNKITMQALADAAGLSKGYISVLEKGFRPGQKSPVIPSIDTYHKIATAMGITVGELFEAIDSDCLVDIARANEPIEFYHASVDALAKEISIEDQLQTVLQQDDYINGFEFSQEQLQKILEYARFIRSQEA